MQQKQYLRSSLQKAFTQFSQMPLDTLLDEKNFLELLDFLAQKKFDRELGLELFNTCTKKQNKFITVDDFIEVFFKAEDELVRQISVVNQKIVALNEQREDLLVKIQDDSAQKKGNNIQEKNLLEISIDIQTAQIARSSYQIDNQLYHIAADCGGIQKSTLSSENFYFNQTLQLSVSRDAQYLNLYLQPQQKKKNEPFIGKIQLNIQSFPSNKALPFQEYFTSSSGQQIPIFLQFIIQLNAPKTTSKYEDKYNEKNTKIQLKEKQLKEIDSNLKTLYLLIRNLDQINSKNQTEIKDVEQHMRMNRNIEYLKNSPNKSQQLQQELQQREQILMSQTKNNNNNETQLGHHNKIFNNRFDEEEKEDQTELLYKNKKEVSYSYDERILIRNFKIVIGVFLLISTLENLEKPAFIEIGSLLALLGLLSSDDLDGYYTIMLGVLIALQFCLDFTWTMLFDLTDMDVLILHFYSQKDYYERFKSIDNENQKYLMIFSYFMMIIGFFYKFFFFHIVFMYYNTIGIKLEDIKNRNLN